jgi:hypothetical protein
MILERFSGNPIRKQLVKLTKEGQKKAKQDKKNNPVSNLFQ